MTYFLPPPSKGFAAFFYWLYAGAITELAARYKTSGGSFDFVKASLGRRAAALMAVLGLLKLILANSALALAISSYMIQGGMSSAMQLPCWILTYGFFTLLDAVGVRQSANVQVLATVLCIILLVFYALSSFTQFSFGNIRRGGLVIDGGIGFFKGLPFSMQFFDGFEEVRRRSPPFCLTSFLVVLASIVLIHRSPQPPTPLHRRTPPLLSNQVPLLMTYALDPERTIPRAIVSCYVSIAAIGAMVLFSGAGITPFQNLIDSEAPLMDGIDAVWGEGTLISDTIAKMIVLGLLVNFFAFVLFASQQVQAIAEAGQLPEFLAYRHPVHGAPITASICASLVGLILTAGFSFVFGEAMAQNTLVTAALMPAVLGYALLLECIVRIRSVERKKQTQALDRRDMMRLGDDPGALRFVYGAEGAKVAQIMCVIFVVGLLVLASTSADFFYGLIVVLVLGVGTFMGMQKFINTNIAMDVLMHGVLDDDDVAFATAKEYGHVPGAAPSGNGAYMYLDEHDQQLRDVPSKPLMASYQHQ